MLNSKTSRVLIFSFNKRRLRFETENYAPSTINNELSKQDLDYFMEELYNRVDQFEQLKWSWMHLIILAAFFILDFMLFGMGIFILNWHVTYAPTPNFLLIYTGLCCIIISMSVYFYTVYRVAIEKKNTASSLLYQMKIYIYEVNHLLEEKNIFWNLPENHFKWLELHYEFKETNPGEKSLNEESNYYTPPELASSC